MPIAPLQRLFARGASVFADTQPPTPIASARSPEWARTLAANHELVTACALAILANGHTRPCTESRHRGTPGCTPDCTATRAAIESATGKLIEDVIRFEYVLTDGTEDADYRRRTMTLAEAEAANAEAEEATGGNWFWSAVPL